MSRSPRRKLLTLAGSLLAVAALPFCQCRDTCMEEVHPSWHGCYQKQGCATAYLDADGGPARDGGGTLVVCGCCDE
jgi:hypothetical protein